MGSGIARGRVRTTAGDGVAQHGGLIIQLHFVEYKKRPKRVQISRGICTPEDRLDRFPAVDQSVSWIQSRANFVPLRILLSRIPP